MLEKRPDHPDFMDSSELKKIQHSGVRNNRIGDCIELWVLGEVVKSVSFMEIKFNPNAFNDAYAEHFGLERVREEGQAVEPKENKK